MNCPDCHTELKSFQTNKYEPFYWCVICQKWVFPSEHGLAIQKAIVIEKVPKSKKKSHTRKVPIMGQITI